MDFATHPLTIWDFFDWAERRGKVYDCPPELQQLRFERDTLQRVSSLNSFPKYEFDDLIKESRQKLHALHLWMEFVEERFGRLPDNQPFCLIDGSIIIDWKTNATLAIAGRYLTIRLRYDHSSYTITIVAIILHDPDGPDGGGGGEPPRGPSQSVGPDSSLEKLKLRNGAPSMARMTSIDRSGEAWVHGFRKTLWNMLSDDDQNYLDNYYGAHPAVLVKTLRGSRGVGKTALAVELVHGAGDSKYWHRALAYCRRRSADGDAAATALVEALTDKATVVRMAVAHRTSSSGFACLSVGVELKAANSHDPVILVLGGRERCGSADAMRAVFMSCMSQRAADSGLPSTVTLAVPHGADVLAHHTLRHTGISDLRRLGGVEVQAMPAEVARLLADMNVNTAFSTYIFCTPALSTLVEGFQELVNGAHAIDDAEWLSENRVPEDERGGRYIVPNFDFDVSMFGVSIAIRGISGGKDEN